MCGTDKKINKNCRKPYQEVLVNTGLYIINPKLLNIIPTKKNMTNPIFKGRESPKNNWSLSCFGRLWIDVGEWDEYKKSANKLNYQKIT